MTPLPAAVHRRLHPSGEPVRSYGATSSPHAARLPRGRTGPGGQAGWWVRLAVSALVAVLAAALLVAAGWSFVAARAAVPLVPAGPGEVSLPGGVAQVDGVLSAARPRHAMPGMGSDEDPVAEDERRVSVDVTLVAGGAGLRYDVEDFRLEAGGRTVAPHRAVLPGERLPAGTWLSGTLVFDVPVEALEGSLSYGDGPTLAVDLPPEGSTGDGTDVPGSADHGREHG